MAYRLISLCRGFSAINYRAIPPSFAPGCTRQARPHDSFLTSRRQSPKLRVVMKKFSILASLLLGFVTGSVQAGGEVYKQVAPPPPPLYGTGFYGAIDAGANVFQNLGDTRTFDDTFTEFGARLDVDLKI